MSVSITTLIVETAFRIGEKLLYDLIKERIDRISKKEINKKINHEAKKASTEQQIDEFQLKQMTEIVVEQSVMRTPGITVTRRMGREYLELDVKTPEKSTQMLADLKNALQKLQLEYGNIQLKPETDGHQIEDDIIIEEASQEENVNMDEKASYGYKAISDLKRRLAEIESENLRK